MPSSMTISGQVAGEHVRRKAHGAREAVLRRVVDRVVDQLHACVGVPAVEVGGEAVEIHGVHILAYAGECEGDDRDGLRALDLRDQPKVPAAVGDEQAARRRASARRIGAAVV